MKARASKGLLLVAASVLLVLGCGGGGGGAGGATAGSIVVRFDWPARTRLIPDAAESIKIDVLSGGTVIATQLAVRPSDQASQTTNTFENVVAGQYEVLATAYPQTDGTGVPLAMGMVAVTVSNGSSDAMTITTATTISTISLTPGTVDVTLGLDTPVSMTALDDQGRVVLVSDSKIDWGIDDGTVASISGNGTVGTLSGLSLGTTNLRVTDSESGVTGSAEVTVSDPVITIVISPKLATVAPGATVQFSAVVTGSPNTLYTFSVSPPAGGSVDFGGLYTAPFTPGVYEVTAISTVRPSVTDAALVTVDNGGVGGLADTYWPVKHGDMRNTGQVKDIIGLFGLDWTFTPFNSVLVVNTPTIGLDGSVYVSGIRVYSVDPATGAQNWSFKGFTGIASAVTVGADGTIYFASADRGVYALDASSGLLKWAYPVSLGVSATPMIDDTNTVYFCSRAGTVYALEGTTGQLKWSYSHGGGIGSTASLATNGNLYVGIGNDVVALNRVSGTFVWSFPTGNGVGTTVVGNDGNVYAGSLDGWLYALDATTGALQWAFQTVKGVHTAPVVDDEGRIFISSLEGKLYALNTADGSLLWSREVPFARFGQPLVAERRAVGSPPLLLVSSEKLIYQFHRATGSGSPGLSLDSEMNSGMAFAADGSMYFCTSGSLKAHKP